MIDLNHSRNLAVRRRAGCFLAVFMLAGLLAASAWGQIFTTLHSFTVTSGPNGSGSNSDGAAPVAGLLLLSNTLYGTAFQGGGSGNGTVFNLNTNGLGFITLHTFTGGSDEANPTAGLISSGNTLYGTAYGALYSFNGTVFKINTDGTGFTNLHSFTGLSDGAEPGGILLSSGNTLYGTTFSGGSNDNGTVFAINTDGTGFTTLHSFTAKYGPYPSTNGDGAYPSSGLILSGNMLFGTASFAGNAGNGTVFAVNTNGTGFTNLHSFTDNEGLSPRGSLVVSGNTLYGTVAYGGSANSGMVFAVNTDGTGFMILHSFTSSDGANPLGGLVLLGDTLYGTANGGGHGDGTIFKVNTDGTAFLNLYNFTGGSDGAEPYSSLIPSGITLYGTAYSGGSSGNGTVFSIFIQPQLTLIPSGSNFVLTWPTNAIGFTLQSTTNLVSPNWTSNFPLPVVVNRVNTVTNPISGNQQFFRLRH